jgi:hypothetical protein
MTQRTNPAYAELAYRRAILRHLVNHMLTRFVGRTGQPPAELIICDEVFREDSEVPNESIVAFVEELQEREASTALELGKFEFRRRDGEQQRDRQGQARTPSGRGSPQVVQQKR